MVSFVWSKLPRGDLQVRILVVPCDGIGPEIIAASMTVMKAVDAKFRLDLQFDYEEAGFESLKKYGKVTPAQAAGLTGHCWTFDELLA